MNIQQYQALLSHAKHGFNTAPNKEAIDKELYEAGWLQWVYPTHSQPGFYEISDKGKKALSDVQNFLRDLV